jgi:hypothetical protein
MKDKLILNSIEKSKEWKEKILVIAIVILIPLAVLIVEFSNSGILSSIPFIKHIKQNPISLIFLVLSALFGTIYFLIVPKLLKLYLYITSLDPKLNELLLLSKGNSVVIEPSKHPEIWDGFINSYYVVNAPWQLEKYMENSKYEDMVDLHVKRYQNAKLKKTTYIIFKKNPFPNSTKNFAKFMEDILKKFPEAGKKIEIIEVDDEAPHYSLFLGEKEFKPEHAKFKREEEKAQDSKIVSYSILYINDKPFLNEDGFPNWAFISINSNLNEILKHYVRGIVHGRYKKENINDFLERFSKDLADKPD